MIERNKRIHRWQAKQLASFSMFLSNSEFDDHVLHMHMETFLISRPFLKMHFEERKEIAVVIQNL
ncbi:hypothetical protein FHS18_003706 [Paenibacillus phyllosphaerae]|uniref:Uncharacterized protein n=1 Tax=Paenibacillus phyllosphaerae TaxID=274593 RepID=A0A7W5AZK5_9BACL|nr:hypothetical protein [Paenibacillus phyllosphaerae]